MLAYHLCDRQIKMTERHAAQAPALRERFHKSTINNQQSTIVNLVLSEA
jgi:hypothetical protein